MMMTVSSKSVLCWDPKEGVYLLFPIAAFGKPGEKPYKYHWVLDRLGEAFGYKSVRLAIPEDLDRTRKVGVQLEEGTYGLTLKTFWLHPMAHIFPNAGLRDGTYDINDHPEHVDIFIEQLKGIDNVR